MAQQLTNLTSIHELWCRLQMRLGSGVAVVVVSLQFNSKKTNQGVPVVAQWLTNPTRNHEVAGSVPALAQWVNDPALP